MDSFKVISWLSKSVYDPQILNNLVLLKACLEDINDEDKKKLFAKYPKLKKVVCDIIASLS